MAVTTEARLRDYGVFSEQTIAAVDEAASQQHNQSFQRLAERYGLEAVPSVHNTSYGMPLEYWHLKPEADYDEQQADIYYAPMAIPADASMAMRAIRLFAAKPERQLLVIGNPGAIGHAANRLPFEYWPAVWRGDIAPAAFGSIDLLLAQGITAVNFLGYSYGAEAATAGASVASDSGIVADKAVLAEPVSATKRSLAGLTAAFAKSGGPLAEYVAASSSPALETARALADDGLPRYVGGLLRATNLAIAKALSRGKFGPQLETTLIEQPTMHATVVHGTRSEIANFEDLSEVINMLIDEFPGRLGRLVVPLMQHAGGDDIDLHAAMMLQGLAQA